MERLFLAAIAALVACGGRNLDAGPEMLVVDEGGATTTGGAGGTGGMAAGGAGGEGGGAEGGSPPNPIDCLGCVALQCPETVACLTDPACVQGLVCGVTQCLNGGQPDLPCVAECFDGDLDAAFQAIQALSCVIGPCGEVCGDFFPF